MYAVIAAFIGVVGVIIGAILNAVLPGSSFILWFARTPRGHNIIGEWNSSWGPLPDGPLQFQEKLTIARQRGLNISGTATMDAQPGKKWEVQGRYDGIFLQMYYFPSSTSTNTDFLDYGCYFLKRKADGSFQGYSTGFGPDDKGSEGIETNYHTLNRR